MKQSEAAQETEPAERPGGRQATRRRTGAILAAATLAPAGVQAAACGGGRERASDGPAAQTAAPVELAAWTWVAGADKQQQLQALSDGVAAEAPRVSVKWAFQGPGDGASALEKLLIAMAGGTPPEVSMMQEAWIPQIGTEPSLLVLDGYLKQAKEDLGDYIPAARAYMQYGDGKTRYLPWYFSPVALFYNTTHFAEAGTAAPPRSWDELVAGARRLVRVEGDRVVRSGAELGANDWHWLPLLWGNGGEFALDGKIVQNSPEGVETLQFLADLVSKHRVMGRPAPAGGFDAGNVGVSIFGSWNVKAKRQQPGLAFDTAAIPSRTGGPAPHPVRMEGLMAFSHPRKDDATWSFLRYLSRPDVAVQYAVGHGYQVPARTSARKARAFAEQIAAEPALKAPVEGMEAANARPMPLVRGWVQIKGLVAKMLAEAQDGQRSPRVILDEYTQQFRLLAGQ